MARVKSMPKHVNRIRGRDGRNRYYYRRPGRKSVRLPDITHSGFEAARAAAEAGAEPIKIGASQSKAGSVAAIVGAYFGSLAFENQAPETRRTRRNILERFREEHGDKPIALISRKHVQAMVDAKKGTPSAARNFLNTLRALMTFAIKIMDPPARADDPTIGITRAKIEEGDGFKMWEEADIAKFEAKHPLGTMPRLALALLLCTGQRRSDVVKMGRQHLQGDMIRVRQQKTGTPLMIPLHADLRAAIDAMPASEHLSFLATAYGKPRTATGFGTWFRACCDEAGIPKGTSAHGLRKAMCRRLAEAGCSAHEIMAISGQKSLREVERYTKGADQKRMARAAMARLGGAQ
jgi:integrase